MNPNPPQRVLSYYERNREARLEKSRQYYWDHREKQLENIKAYQQRIRNNYGTLVKKKPVRRRARRIRRPQVVEVIPEVIEEEVAEEEDEDDDDQLTPDQIRNTVNLWIPKPEDYTIVFR